MFPDHTVIVIGRCFGAGGRAIGRELSAILGVPCYDDELLKEAAREFGFPSEVFARADEKRPPLFKRLVSQAYGVQEAYVPTVTSENLYQAQSRVIRQIASRGPCIIIGRTADYILRDFPGLVSVFLHAPLAFRARKIVERDDAPSVEDAIELARRKDRSRQEYYNYLTGRRWGCASNYDLTLDSSLLPVEAIASIIATFVGKIRVAL